MIRSCCSISDAAGRELNQVKSGDVVVIDLQKAGVGVSSQVAR